MLFSNNYFMAVNMAKNEKYAAGSLNEIADGVLLNQRQVAQILGITPPTAAGIIKNNAFKTIRLADGKNSPIFIYAGDLKRFLEKGGVAPAPLESLVDTIAAASEPTATNADLAADKKIRAGAPHTKKQTPTDALEKAGLTRWAKKKVSDNA